jgi:hypothetical protein
MTQSHSPTAPRSDNHSSRLSSTYWSEDSERRGNNYKRPTSSLSNLCKTCGVRVRARAGVGVKRTDVIIYVRGRVATGWRRVEAAYREGLGGEGRHKSDACCAGGERRAIPAGLSEKVLQCASCGSWSCGVTAAALLNGESTACARARCAADVPRVDLGSKSRRTRAGTPHELAVQNLICGRVRRGAAHGRGNSFFNPAYGC